MTPSEAATLLGHIAAFDRRTVGKTDAKAWARALHDLPLDDDALDAVAQFFGDPQRDPEAQRWIQPHHVRTIRQAIRADRIEAANLIHEPAADETPIGFIERRRAQLAAAGDGRLPPSSVRHALEGGPHPTVARALTAIGGHVPPLPSPHPPPYVPEMARKALAQAVPRYADRHDRFPELAIGCPRESCRALPRRACKRPSGTELRDHTHDARQQAWADMQRQGAPDAS